MEIVISNLYKASWVLTSIDALLMLLCLSAICFYCYAIYAAGWFFGHPNLIDHSFHPPLSILKPVCGLDSDTYENLASFCCQDYPDYQVIFAIREQHDPAVPVVQKIIYNFSNIDIQLVISERTTGTNLKVSNLENALAAAKHKTLLIADSDIRVGSDYLRRVIQPLRDPTVGVVTCLYRSLVQGWVATLEALGTSTEFHASVLVARNLQGIKFAFGSTIVLQKAALEAIGGFAAIANYLADDFQLGNLAALAGYKVVLSDYVVEHVLSTSSMADSIQRQIRWARCIRVSRPWGYLGLIFTHGTVTSLLFLIATGGSIFGWMVAGITWATRLAMAWVVGVKGLKDPVVKKCLWLVPLRDIISFVLWCYGFIGDSIKWRGQRLKLIKGGLLVPLTTDSPKMMSS